MKTMTMQTTSAEPAGAQQAPAGATSTTAEQRRLIGVIADKIEDGSLFQSGIYSKKDLARFVRNILEATPQAAPAAPSTPTSDKWQKIETAPKNGQTLLLGYFNSAGKWRTTRGQWVGQDYIYEYAEEPECMEPGWHETTAEDDDGKCWPIDPTHWQPLPASPTIEADSVMGDAARLERERICAAIKAEDDHCVEHGDYMLDSDDCIKIVRGEWVRPDYLVDAARKQGGV